jgi:hypothetical protein
MALVSASKYISKPFGEYAIQVCKKTKYFNALHLLDVYNESHGEQKIRKDMIKYMGRSTFMKQVDADFNFIVDKKLIDYEYLNSIMSISQENDGDSDGDRLSPSLISAETSETDIKTIEKDIKFRYMVRKVESGYNKILSLDVNPMSAIGLAMWLSPAFGAKVKDVFLRFIEGDAYIIKETIQNRNIATGLINNLETTTDPDTNEISMLITTFEKNDYMAKIKNDRHKREIQQLIDEKNGIINKQKCRIDELLIQMKENEKKADDERKKADERFNRLMGHAENSEIKAEEERGLANIERKKADITRKKLDKVLPQRVDIDETDLKHPKIFILKNCNKTEKKYNLYVMRCQSSSYNTRLKQLKTEYGNDIRRIKTLKQPNAVVFWNTIKEKLKNNLDHDSASNWFNLVNMTRVEFKKKINELDKKRIKM